MRVRAAEMLVIVLAGLGAVNIGEASAAQSRVRVGDAVRLPRNARVLGRLRATRTLRVAVALQPQHPTELRGFATAVSTPGSPQYGDYLSASQFARRFGVTPAHLAAVRSMLRRAGLRVGAATTNDLTLSVVGTVARLQRAFSVAESRVRLPSGRVAYANDQAPRLPAAVAPYVQGVIGLDDVAVPLPVGLAKASRRAHGSAGRPATSPSAPTARPGAASNARRPRAITDGPIPCQATTLKADLYPSAYTTDEVAGAYGFNGFYQAGDEGAGQTVAVLETAPYQDSDVGAYQSCYSTSASVTRVEVDGGPGIYSGGDDGEPALDIEQIIGLAPRVNVLDYEGPGTSFAAILSRIVSDNVAKTVSISYGSCELLSQLSDVNSENTSLERAAAQGQSVFAASGDSGAQGCFPSTNTDPPEFSLSVNDPASQPFITGVGGTLMCQVISPQCVSPVNGSYPGEFVWNSGATTNTAGGVLALNGTGGGVSMNSAMPPYQLNSSPGLNVLNSESSKACGGQFCREVPDVSAMGDYDHSPYIFYFADGQGNDGWLPNGGTSAASPLWAALTALADASPTCRGLSLGFANPALYSVGGSSYLSDFHDISAADPFTGQADNDTLYGYTNDPGKLFHTNLGPGYDMATGIGSPIASALGASLCALRAPVYTVAVASPGALTTSVGQGVALQIHASDSGGAGLGYSASGLPAGLSINPANGVISGTPTTPQSTVVTIAAGDGYKNSGSTQFTWTIKTVPVRRVSRPRATSVRLSGLGQRRPKLSFEVRAGANAPALKSVSISVPKGLSFARSKGPLVRGLFVKVNGHRRRFAATIRNTPNVANGRLTITFTTSLRDAKLTIQKPAIIVSGRLAQKIKRHLISKVVIPLNLIDTLRRATASKITLRKLS